ncbi:MAG: RNase P subunit p30 family protein [Halobacteriaceae archaeon]
MYEAVRPPPAGASTVARYAATAARYGFEGVVVRAGQDGTDGAVPEGVAESYGVDVVDAVEVRVDDPSRAGGAIGNARSSHTLVFLRGGSARMNRFAVESPKVDVLTAPLRDGGDLNHVLVRAAADNDVAIEVNLGRVLRASGGRRVTALRGLRKLGDLLAKYDAPFVVSADPASHLEVRAPRELAAVGEAVGFGADRTRAGLQAWGAVAARNRERRGEDYVAPGVRRGPYGGADGPDAAGTGEDDSR